ncbi:MAG: response regulator transcription factor [Ruminococcus sp.]|nr:response regulator transcription factor [Ruminococcus sp.]
MIYFVEDDNSIRELVIYTLNNSGMEAEGFEKPSGFWRAMESKKPSLILLDIMLPEEDGLTVLRKLRANPAHAQIPVMMLTAKGSEFDKVVGLDAGADDYLPKPFGMMELIARVKALLRRSGAGSSGKEYHLGRLMVNPEKHLVHVDGKDVVLTFKEFEMLCLLLKNQGMVLTRDQFLNQVWGYNFDGENRTVDVHIRTLRQKLGEAGCYIRTIRGIGYKIEETEDEV